MWRLIIWFLIAAGLAWGLTWVANHPGTITVEWLGWRIEDMPVALALAALLIGLLVLWVAFRLLRWLIGAPFAITDMFRTHRRRKAMREMSTGLTALMAGDAETARRAAHKAARLLPDDPMTQLLEAQAELQAGNLKAAQHYLAQLKENPETEPAALHGMFELAQREGNVEAAKAIAEQALRRYPNLPWAAEAMLKFAALAGDWPRVRALLARMRKAKLIDKAEEKRKLAVTFAAEAQALEEQEPEKALEAALQAHKLDPSLVPAAVIAGRLLAQQGKLRKAAKVLEQTWKLSPHPDIAEVYAHLRHGDSPADRLARVRQLLKKSSGGEEGAVALARAAIDAHEWDVALGALRPWLNENPSARIFLLMAELEEARSGDIGRMREWLRRARMARPDPAWVAGSYISPVWLPITPDGVLGAFRWQEPPTTPGTRVLGEPVPKEWLEAPVRVAEPGEEPAEAGEPKMIEAQVKEAGEAASGEEKAEEESVAGKSAGKAASAEERAESEKAGEKAGEKKAAPEKPRVVRLKSPAGAEAVADLPEEGVARPPLPDDPGPVPEKG